MPQAPHRRGRGRPMGATTRRLIERHIDALQRVHVVMGCLLAASQAGDRPRVSRLLCDLEGAAAALIATLADLDGYCERRRRIRANCSQPPAVA